MNLMKLLAAAVSIVMPLSFAHAQQLPDGSADNPIRVIMVPAEIGSRDTLSDYRPVFNAITKEYGIHFDLKLGDSYAAAVQGLCNDQADIGWYGAVTYGQARELCGAELLAVDVKKGNSVYYSGIYASKDSGLETLADLKEQSLAVGDPNSTSSFNFPFAMVIDAGIDPAKDLGKIVIAGSHTNSIAALKEGRVTAAAASFNAWEKAVKKGIIDPTKFKVLAKSEGIPNPPLAMNAKLDPEVKKNIRIAFSEIHTKVDPQFIRGYGGKTVDRYDTDYPLEKMLGALDKLSALTKRVKGEIIEKAGER
ncbi:MAG: phosphate/phosphite/phosphonate ABC transporter substrate-binding protein [Pseudomonadota bacterium]